jgi:hypothetical protein
MGHNAHAPSPLAKMGMKQRYEYADILSSLRRRGVPYTDIMKAITQSYHCQQIRWPHALRFRPVALILSLSVLEEDTVPR